MTLSDLANKATGEDDEVIPLSNGEARDIVEIVTEADMRRLSLIERNAELEARIAELQAEAEQNRRALADALTPKAAA